MSSKTPSRQSSRIATLDPVNYNYNRNNNRNNNSRSNANRPNTENNSNNITINTSNTTSSTPQSAEGVNRTVLATNSVTPLMSIRFPPGLGPRTHSSPESQSTIPSPAYSSLTAQGIRRDFSRMSRQPRRLPTLGEHINPDMPINEDGLSLREYVSASVVAAEASIMRHLQQNLNELIPQRVRETLRSERNTSFDQNQFSTFGSQNRGHPNEQTNRSQQSQQQQQFQRQPLQFPPPQQFQNPPPPFQQPQHPPYQQQHQQNYQQYPQPPFHQQNQQQQHRPQPGPMLFSQQNMAMGYGNKPFTPHQLEKWNIKFDGLNKSHSVEDFVFQAECLRLDYGCPEDVFPRGFHHLLKDRANRWFWEFRQQNPTCIWETLKYHLIKKFRNYESDFEIQRRIVERRQLPSESADAFISEIMRLRNQMRMKIPEYELVRTIKDNLKEGLVQLIYPKDIDTMDELLEECKRAERNISKRNANRQQIQNYRRVNELEYDDTLYENDFQIDAFNQATAPAKQLVCWNCKKPGHSFVDCVEEQRNLFCYKCGFDGVTSPKCPRCLGNTPRNMMKAGPTCSKESPAQ